MPTKDLIDIYIYRQKGFIIIIMYGYCVNVVINVSQWLVGEDAVSSIVIELILIIILN